MGNFLCGCRPSRSAVDTDDDHAAARHVRVCPEPAVLQSWSSDPVLQRRSRRISAEGGPILITELSRSITDQFHKAGIAAEISPPTSSGYASALLDSEYSTMDSARGYAFLRKQYSGSEYSSYNSQSGGTLRRRFRSYSKPVPVDPCTIPEILWLRKSAAESQRSKEVEEMKRGLHPDHASTINRHFRYLKDEIDPEVLSDYFVKHLMFNDDDLDEIMKEGPRRQQVDLLLRKLLRCRADRYDTFLSILLEAEYSYVRDKLLINAPPTELNPDVDLDLEDMRDRIFNNYDVLVDQLEPHQILDFFIVYEVMDMDGYEEILGEKSRRAKAKALVEFIEHRLQSSADAYHVLILALKDDAECGQYMLNKLNQSSDDTDQDTASGQTSPVSVTLKFGRCTSSRRSTDGKIMLTLKLKKTRNSRHKERRVLDALRKSIHTINHKLIQETDYQITSAELGSIIIYLKECSSDAFERFTALCNNGGLAGVLETLFSQPEVSQCLPKEAVLTVMVSQQQDENTTKSAPRNKDRANIQDRLRRNMPYFMEELDALRYVKDLQELGVLTAEEVDNLLHSPPVSRRHRLSRMFQLFLEKGDWAIHRFVDVLKRQKKTNLVQRLDPGSVDPGSVDPGSVRHEDTLEDGNDLLKNYSMLVEEMSPRTVIDDATGRGVLESEIELPRDQGRRGQAMYLLQKVLISDSGSKKVFCQVLQDNGYTLYLSLPDESEIGPSDNVSASPRNVSLTPKTLPAGAIFTGKILIKREQTGSKSNKIQKEVLNISQTLLSQECAGAACDSTGTPVQRCPKVNLEGEGKTDSGYSSHNDLNNTVSTSHSH